MVACGPEGADKAESPEDSESSTDSTTDVLHTGEPVGSGTGDTGVVVAHSGGPTTLPGPCDALPPPLVPTPVSSLTLTGSAAFDLDDRGYVHYVDPFGALRVSDGASYDVAGPLVSSYADGHTLRALGGETVLASGGLGLLIEVAYDYPYVDEGNTATLLMTREVEALDPLPGDDVVALVTRGGDLALYDRSTALYTVVDVGVSPIEGAVAWSAGGDALWVLTTAGLERYDYNWSTGAMTPGFVAASFPPNLVTGLAVDTCENVYLLTVTGEVRRYNPRSGSVDPLGSFPSPWARQLRWGSGAGPYRRDRLYSLVLDTVFEVDVGFVGAAQPIDYP